MVRDVIARRTDGRPRHADPFKAFRDQIPKLGYPHLQFWWDQTCGEMQRSGVDTAPVTVSVLSAAIVEAALTIVAKDASASNVTFTKVLPTDPKEWKLQTLLGLAKTGTSPIFDGKLGDRGMQLNEIRQRIHIARYLTAQPHEIDIRPEQARAAKETAEQLVRAILDWLAKYPPAT